MAFELSNEQRVYFGLEIINPDWERVPFRGDAYRPDSVLYFEGDTIKRHIISTDEKYDEKQYNDLTKGRSILLPATIKGKEKKLTASVLELRQPHGVYCHINIHRGILIGNYNTQTTFYSNRWESHNLNETAPIDKLVSNFISTSPPSHLSGIEFFKNAKRKNVKFKPGDFFAFKINRTEYGFGRILLNIDELKKKNILSQEHGLSFIMSKPVLIKFYAYTSKIKNVNISDLIGLSCLPSDYMMDNLLFYGEYEIIGNKPLTIDEMDFPMSYGRHIDHRRNSIFFQWGLINIELPSSSFNKYLVADNTRLPEGHPSRRITNPYGYYSVGFSPSYSGNDIMGTILNDGFFDYQNTSISKANFDLRNPQNHQIKDEIMKAFGLDIKKNYAENSLLTKTIDVIEIMNS